MTREKTDKNFAQKISEKLIPQKFSEESKSWKNEVVLFLIEPEITYFALKVNFSSKILFLFLGIVRSFLFEKHSDIFPLKQKYFRLGSVFD
jgi:hypothetical protein